MQLFALIWIVVYLLPCYVSLPNDHCPCELPQPSSALDSPEEKTCSSPPTLPSKTPEYVAQESRLLALYRATSTNSWFGWSDPTRYHFCRWLGVICDVTCENVTVLNLDSFSFTGVVPSDFAPFPSLDTLFLDYTNLTGFDCLFNNDTFPQLTTLYVGTTRLTSLPDLSQLPMLDDLRFGNSPVAHMPLLPPSLSKLIVGYMDLAELEHLPSGLTLFGAGGAG